MQDAMRRGILERAEIKALAKLRFKAHYWPMVAAAVIPALVVLLLGATYVGWLAAFAAGPVLQVHAALFFLLCWRGERPQVASLFQNFFDGFGRKLGGMLWAELKAFLWSLLFVIPGIVKALAYSMTPYILAEYPGVSAMDASVLSERITQGYKGDVFVMALSFIGWMLLSAFTFGVVHILYTGPYMNTAMAGLYEELMQNALQEGRITREMLDGSPPVL